jgi:hypothetical protein
MPVKGPSPEAVAEKVSGWPGAGVPEVMTGVLTLVARELTLTV